jgi:hypothetical protein
MRRGIRLQYGRGRPPRNGNAVAARSFLEPIAVEEEIAPVIPLVAVKEDCSDKRGLKAKNGIR